MHEHFAYIHVCAPHACSACRNQKRESGPLGLELQMVVSTTWGLGIESGSLEELAVLLTSEPSLQSPTDCLFNICCWSVTTKLIAGLSPACNALALSVRHITVFLSLGSLGSRDSSVLMLPTISFSIPTRSLNWGSLHKHLALYSGVMQTGKSPTKAHKCGKHGTRQTMIGIRDGIRKAGWCTGWPWLGFCVARNLNYLVSHVCQWLIVKTSQVFSCFSK